MTIKDNKEYIGVLLYSYYTTITGWGGVLLRLGLGFRVQDTGAKQSSRPNCLASDGSDGVVALVVEKSPNLTQLSISKGDPSPPQKAMKPT